MTTFYLDPVNGNDANDGTTFANRWKTLTSGATAARTAPGDTIRIMETPGPTATGRTGTYTYGSPNVVLDSAVTTNIANCDTIWTGVTNSVATLNTASKREGTGCASIAINATFTTGKAAYFATGALSLTGFQQVSYSLQQTAGTAAVAGDYSIALCSDTTGDVPVYTIPMKAFGRISAWFPQTYNFGADLSTTINSIALYVNVDRGAVTFLLDNFIACKAASDAQCITLDHLISRNVGDVDDWWFPRSINGTTIVMDNFITAVSVGYSGTTGTYSLYTRPVSEVALTTTQTGTTWGNLNEGGSAGNPIIYSGGWNSTDMSTKTGTTVLSGVNYYGYGVYNNGISYVNFVDISFVKFYSGILGRSWTGTVTYFNCSGEFLNFNANGGLELYTQSTFTNYCTYNFGSCSYNGTGFLASSGTAPLTGCKITIGILSNCGIGVNYGLSTYLSTFNIGKVYTSNAQGVIFNNLSRCDVTIDSIYQATKYAAAHSGPGLTFNGAYECNLSINTLTSTDVNAHQSFVMSNSDVNKVRIGYFSMLDNGNGSSYGLYLQGSSSLNDISIESNGSIASSPRWILSTNGINYFNVPGMTTSNAGVTQYGRNVIINYGGTPNVTKVAASAGTISSDTTTTNTSGTSWSFAPIADRQNSSYPLSMELAKVYVVSGSAVTVTAYTRRDNAGQNIGIRVIGDSALGVSTATALNTAANNTWQQVTLTFTPTTSGVVRIDGVSYGTNTGWIDDIAITQ